MSTNYNPSKYFYIDGQFQGPIKSTVTFPVINPATEEKIFDLPMGDSADVDAAVKAAVKAFPAYSAWSVQERIALFERLVREFKHRQDDMAAAINKEMGAPLPFAKKAQAWVGLKHLEVVLENLKTYHFEERRGTALVIREPIGVCGLITPWNWAANQLSLKVFAAMAVGCTVVVKPSEFTPTSAKIYAEIMDSAGVPPGVFNLIQGNGPDVGVAMSEHPNIDMISFTGSTRAGIDVARRGAETVKRISQVRISKREEKFVFF